MSHALTWVCASWKAHKQKILNEYCAVEWTDAMDEWDRCWCCGLSAGKRLQRCHIVAKSIGGTDEAINLVPLCRHCHDIMPDTPDPDFFWEWIKKQQNPLSGVGLGRHWQLYQAIVDALNGRDVSKCDPTNLTKRMKELGNQAAIHFAQSNKGPDYKISTMEWVVTTAIKELPPV